MALVYIVLSTCHFGTHHYYGTGIHCSINMPLWHTSLIWHWYTLFYQHATLAYITIMALVYIVLSTCHFGTHHYYGTGIHCSSNMPLWHTSLLWHWYTLFYQHATSANITTMVFKGLRPVREGVVVTMHEGMCKTGSQILRLRDLMYCCTSLSAFWQQTLTDQS